MKAQQLEIEVLYSPPPCESAASMFDLRGVVNYLAQRAGITTGRIWFGARNAINVTLRCYGAGSQKLEFSRASNSLKLHLAYACSRLILPPRC